MQMSSLIVLQHRQSRHCLLLNDCQNRLYRSEEHTSELQSLRHLVCRLLLEKEEHTSELQSLRHLVCRLLLEKKKDTSAACAIAVRWRSVSPVLLTFVSSFFFFFFF